MSTIYYIRNLLIISIICILTSFIYSCVNSSQNRGFKVLHYNQHNPITSLDPAFARSQNNIWAINHIYNGLVQLDDSLNIKPCLAGSWSISSDGLIYTFRLRSDVWFHENRCFDSISRKVMASDVVYSFKRILDPNLASPGSWIFQGKLDDNFPFESLNDSTFVLRLKEPFIPMLGILTMQYCSIIPHEAIEYYGDQFRSKPVGTGPFMIKRWEEDQGLFLIKNEQYFEAIHDSSLLKLDGIRTSFIKDKKIAFLELLNGNIDYMSGLESSFVNDLLDSEGKLRADRSDKLQFIKSPYLNMEYFGINMELAIQNPLKDKQVRQALNYALDKELMLRSLRNNVGLPANNGFVPYGLPSFDSSLKGYTYDPMKAKQLLIEAGFKDSKGPSITLYTNKDYLDLTLFVAHQWEEVGFEITVETEESAVLRDGMRKSSISFFRASWIADYPDAESFLGMFYSKNPAPPNYTRFSNEDFDRLYEMAIGETDQQLRYSYYRQMDSIVIDEAPVVFLFYDQVALLASKNVQNISSNALNLLQVKQLDEVTVE